MKTKHYPGRIDGITWVNQACLQGGLVRKDAFQGLGRRTRRNSDVNVRGCRVHEQETHLLWSLYVVTQEAGMSSMDHVEYGGKAPAAPQSSLCRFLKDQSSGHRTQK